MTDDMQVKLVALVRNAVGAIEGWPSGVRPESLGSMLQGIGLIAIAIELDNMNSNEKAKQDYDL